jgi:RND family efflux transporter MFP subunit
MLICLNAPVKTTGVKSMTYRRIDLSQHQVRTQAKALGIGTIGRTRGKQKFSFSIPLVFATVFFVSASGLNGQAWATQEQLETSVARYEEVPQEETFDAVIEPVKQATVSAQTTGRIVEINFDVDDFVPKGSVLLRFTNKEQKAELDAAKAALREADARFNEAQSELERVQNVYKKKLVSKAALDKATADFKAAKQRLEQAKSRVAQAQEQYDYTVVKAPYDGIVVKREVEVGETARVGQPLMTGFSLETLRALVHVPEALVDDVRKHSRARVMLTAVDGQSVQATKVTVYPYGDPVSHTFRVRLELPSGLKGVYPGMFAKAAFVTGTYRRLLVPASAVVHRSDVTAVYVLDENGHISFHQIRAGQTIDDHIEVLAGLNEGERVALDPIKAGVKLKEQYKGERK